MEINRMYLTMEPKIMAIKKSDEENHKLLQFKMTQAERIKVSRLIHIKNKLYEQRESGKLLLDDYRLAANTIVNEIDIIANEIGKRILGELPLTLRTDWSDHIQRNPVVVLKIELSSWRSEFHWMGQGYELRKDGSVGIKRGGIRLDNCLVWRRHLDGTWKPLINKAKKESN